VCVCVCGGGAPQRAGCVLVFCHQACISFFLHHAFFFAKRSLHVPLCTCCRQSSSFLEGVSSSSSLSVAYTRRSSVAQRRRCTVWDGEKHHPALFGLRTLVTDDGPSLLGTPRARLPLSRFKSKGGVLKTRSMHKRDRAWYTFIHPSDDGSRSKLKAKEAQTMKREDQPVTTTSMKTLLTTGGVKQNLHTLRVVDASFSRDDDDDDARK